MLTRDQILAADDLPKVEVPTPEWSGSVFVRTMSASERDRFEAEHLKDQDRDVRARLAIYTACDESGALLFRPEDLDALGRKSAAALSRVFDAALKLNRISAGDVEELAGNSNASPSAGSSSGSPATSA